MPNVAPDGPLDTQQKGLLSAIGDPLGQVMGVATKPVGQVTGAVGNPTGEASERAQNTVKYETKYSNEDKSQKELPGGAESVGGKQQTGENPLGL